MAVASDDADEEGGYTARDVGADMDWPGSEQTRGCFCSYDGFLPHRRCAVQPLDYIYGHEADTDGVQLAAYRRCDFDREGGSDAVCGY